MPALSTSARNTLATNLAAVGVKVHKEAPAVPIPPCLVITPSQQWITPTRLGSALNYEISFRVLVVADGRTNAAAMTKCETLIDSLLQNVGSGFSVETVSAPSLVDLGGKGSALTVETTVTAQVKE